MEQKVYFENSNEIKLCGILSDDNKDNPIIILVHGFHSNKDRKTAVTLQNLLNKHNFSTFRIDLFGHGESEGNIEDITISEAVDDIKNAISYLKDQGFTKIGLLGSSFGGIASIMVASQSNDIYVLALKCPVSNYEEKERARIGDEGIKEWKEKGYIIRETKRKWKFYEDFKNNNGYEAAKNIKIPTIIVHGDKDDVVSVEQSKKTASIIENCRLEIIEGTDHDFSGPGNFDKMINFIVDFIVEYS